MNLSQWSEKHEARPPIDVTQLNGTEIAHCFYRVWGFSEATEEDSAAALDEIKLRVDIFLASIE